MLTTIVPVILSGGSGTRLWPLSRALFPKQFIRFFGGSRASLLGDTLARLGDAGDFAPPLILCNDEHRFLVRDEAARAGIEPSAIILEPVARNTAPAIAVAALHALRDGGDPVVAVMPSDHLVRRPDALLGALRTAANVAAQGRLVLFGVKPTEAHTGYGYIRMGDALDGHDPGAFAVAGFTEKPGKQTARDFLARGGYFWNSGIFVLHARTFLDELERLQPAVAEAARRALEGARPDLGFLRLEPNAFAASPSISVDYAVMEKTPLAAMLPVDFGWSDVGSWSSLWEVSPRDTHGNAVHGDSFLEDTSGSYIHGGGAIVAALGVRDLVIVNTPDALLVADRGRAEDVQKIVERLRQSNRPEEQRHLRSYRPWGWFETLSIGPRFQVKLLNVDPGAALSMQMHHHRSEHWTVVSGTARVSIAGEDRHVHENESVYITAGQWHRLENPGKIALQIIEVQLGGYLGEDDIIRAGEEGL